METKMTPLITPLFIKDEEAHVNLVIKIVAFIPCFIIDQSNDSLL